MIGYLLLGGACFSFGILILGLIVYRDILPRLKIKGFIVSKQQEEEEELHWIYIKRIDGRQASILVEDLNIHPFDKDIIIEWINEIIQDGIYIQ